MRLRKGFVIIASALCAAVVLLVAGSVVHGQAGWSVMTGEERSAAGDQAERRLVEIMGGGGGRLGVTVRDLTASDVSTLKLAGPRGVVVDEVEKDSPAAKAGVKAGDVIVQFDGETVRSAQQFTRLVRETPAGRAVKLGVMRDGKRAELDATLAEAKGVLQFGGRDFAMWQDQEGVRQRQNLESLRENLNRLRERTPEPPAAQRAPRAPRGNQFFFQTPGGALGWATPGGRGRLGVTVQDLTPELSTFFGVKDGVLIASVNPDSPAAKAGIKVGDVVTMVNDKTITSTEELVAALGDKDGEVTLGVVRDKKTLNLEATLEGSALKRKTPVRKTPV
jgi:serine protease Do